MVDMTDGAFIMLRVATFALYAAIAIVVFRRPVAGDVKAANETFGLWWAGIAVTTGIGVVQTALFLSGITHPAIHRGLANTSLVAIVVALWALMFYLVFVFTGKKGWRIPLVGFYGILLVVFFIFTAWSDPYTYVMERGQVTALNRNEAAGPLIWALIILLIPPVLIAAAAYGSLAFKISHPAKRRRIAVTALGILVWFATPLVTIAIGRQSDVAALVTATLAFLMPLFILLAYLSATREERVPTRGWSGA